MRTPHLLAVDRGIVNLARLCPRGKVVKRAKIHEIRLRLSVRSDRYDFERLISHELPAMRRSLPLPFGAPSHRLATEA